MVDDIIQGLSEWEGRENERVSEREKKIRKREGENVSCLDFCSPGIAQFVTVCNQCFCFLSCHHTFFLSFLLSFSLIYSSIFYPYGISEWLSE